MFLSISHRYNVDGGVLLEQAQIRVGDVAPLRESKVEQILVRGRLEGVLHVEEYLGIGPIDQPAQLDRVALVQIHAVQFIIGNFCETTIY